MNKLRQTLIGMGLSVPLVLAGTYLTAPSEGLVLGTYKDPVGIVTSCYGHTGKELRMGMKFSEKECAKQIGEDLLLHDKQLFQVVKVPYQSPYMHAALVDFTYNVGIGNVKSSTLLKKLNAGDYASACYELTKWVYAKQNGIAIKLKGLVTRRTKEYQWCMGEVPEEVKNEYAQLKQMEIVP